MPSVDDTALRVDLAPDRSVVLDSYWESWGGGFASVTIRRIVEKSDWELDVEDLFYEEIPEWADGDFANKDVIRRFGGRFQKIVEKERRLVQLSRPGKQPAGKRRGPVDVKGYYKGGKWIEKYTRKAPRRVRNAKR